MVNHTVVLAGMPGGWELILIFLVVLILFGAKRLPELARGLGQSIREFKGAVDGVQKEIKDVTEGETKEPGKDA
ncbi:MAG: twin-arginine translocase TatA/TatE family subunit [Candidatus Neomarinimicrobiota bacterium]